LSFTLLQELASTFGKTKEGGIATYKEHSYLKSVLAILARQTHTVFHRLHGGLGDASPPLSTADELVATLAETLPFIKEKIKQTR
jgi:hypothetical protein